MTRGLDKQRYRVLDMDVKGNLYFYKTALLCKNEIIKRLTNGTYQMVEASRIGMDFTPFYEKIMVFTN